MKVTDTFAPFNHNDVQSERIARRLGFHFHITLWGDTVEHTGWKSESRKATAPEVAMWARLVPAEWVPKEGYRGESVLALVAREDEMLVALRDIGPITMSAQDFTVLRSDGRFTPCNDRELLGRGCFGTWEGESPVWVSRSIPVGYYWRGVYETVRPTRENGVPSIPDVDPVLEAEVQSELRAFRM